MLSLSSNPSGMLKKAKSPEITQRIKNHISLTPENCKDLERVWNNYILLQSSVVEFDVMELEEGCAQFWALGKSGHFLRQAGRQMYPCVDSFGAVSFLFFITVKNLIL